MNNNNSNNNNSPRSRRDFLKRIGLGATVTGLALAGCESAGRKAAGGLSSSVAVPDGKMTTAQTQRPAKRCRYSDMAACAGRQNPMKTAATT